MTQAQTLEPWPDLPWESWQTTAETLHLWMQIVGKTRLALTPRQNHWWNVPLYVSVRGLTTSAMPLPNGELLEIEFDFFASALRFQRSNGQLHSLPLRPRSVAEFYVAYFAALETLGVSVSIDPHAVELPTPIRLDRDTEHQSYDAEAVFRFWRILVQADTLLKRFSTGFLGKISPVHFFWGSFDLAVTRFSGRTAPARPGADPIQSEAYSHEVISAGFWPGNGGLGEPAFYCYAAPVPESLPGTDIPGPGAWDGKLGEFLLRYSEVRSQSDPAQTVLSFLESTYNACADAARWDRAALDRRDWLADEATHVPKRR